MSSHFTKYSTTTKEIVGSFSGVNCVAPDAEQGYAYIEGIFSAQTHYVDDYGNPQEYSEQQRAAKAARPNTPARWSNDLMEWVDVTDINASRGVALESVDTMAGQARLRYITSVPGQAETYAKKEQQARDWAAASFAGDAPSFIAAEAQALNVSAQSVALEVIGLAEYWSNIKGPQIEATRRKWKVAIGSAQDAATVDSLIEQARAELEAL